MIHLFLNNLNNLNVSIKVGDMVYATPTKTQAGAEDLQHTSGPTGSAKLVGVLRRIAEPSSGIFRLDVYETPFTLPYVPGDDDFIMFSKYSQTDGDINGYYAKANFVNDSREKAELFAVSSEIVINSK